MKKLLITLLILSLIMVCVVPCYSQGGRDYQARVLSVSKWIDLSGRIYNRIIIPFVDGDATPSVYSSNTFKTANTAPTIITTFDNGILGQQIAVLFGDSNTTIDFSGTNLLGNGGVDWTATQDDILAAVFDGTNWYCTIPSSSTVSGGSFTITGDDPTLFLDTDTTGDLDIWFGIQEDSDGTTAGDTLAIGTGGTKGSNTKFAMDVDGDMVFGGGTLISTSQYQFLMDATKNILIDGSTNQRNMTLGLVRILHTPTIPDTTALNFIIDANSQGDTHAIRVALSATSIIAGEAIQGLGISLDSANSTGGVMEALRVSNGGAGVATAEALHIDPSVAPIHQESGSFGAVEQGWDENGGFTDVTAAFNDAGTDVTIFSANADKIYIGNTADFNSILVNLATVASGAGIKPTFEFSIAGPAWTTFTPNDATNGFRVSAQITFDGTTLSGWAAVDVNGATKKYIRITRTQVGLPTPPIEDTIQVTESVEYEWDADGDVSINDLTVGGTKVSTPSATQAITAVGNTILANAELVVLNPDGDYTMISTPTIADGTTGQSVYITCANAEANTITLQDETVLGGTNLRLKGDETEITGKTITQFVFDGTDWVEFGTQVNTTVNNYKIKGDLIIQGPTILDPSATQVINAVGDTILANATLILLNPDADYILTSTPTIANGTEGQVLLISCDNAETNTVTLQDAGLLGSSNLRLKSSTTTVVGKKAITFVFDGTEWVETGQQDIQSAQVTIMAPDGVNDEIPMLHVDAEKYPRGIIAMNVQITVTVDTAYAMVFEEWSGDPPAAQADIETVTTTGTDSYMEVRTTDIDNRLIDADDYIFLDIPVTVSDWIMAAIFFYSL